MKSLDRELIKRYDIETMQHVFRVAARVPEDHPEHVLLYRVAVFHDWLEDGLGTKDELREAGFGEREIRLIALLARRDGETYRDYLWRLGDDPDAVTVKLCDLADNIARNEASPKGNLLTRYRAARNFLEARDDHFKAWGHHWTQQKSLEKSQEGGCK